MILKSKTIPIIYLIFYKVGNKLNIRISSIMDIISIKTKKDRIVEKVKQEKLGTKEVEDVKKDKEKL